MAAPGSGGIPIKADQDSDGSAQSTADMTAFVQNLLMQMSINDLKVEMGTEGITPTKPRDEESKPADSSAE
uniref:Heat shock factor binding protein n=1 Tax=Oryza punctata TaxID=4537 RepID=A0A0E0LAC7_ORYPU